MRKIALTTLFVSATILMGFAQIQTTISEETRAMSKGSFNCIILDLPGTDAKEVGKAWKNFVGQYKGKTRQDKKTDEFFTDDATVKEMSDNTVDFIAKVSPKGEGGSELAVWYNLGVTYLSSNEHPERYPAAEVMLKLFTKEVSMDMIESELKAAEKLLKDQEKELKEIVKDQETMVKDIENYKKEIAELEQKIAENETKIEENKVTQETKGTEIEDQKAVIEEIRIRLETVKSGG